MNRGSDLNVQRVIRGIAFLANFETELTNPYQTAPRALANSPQFSKPVDLANRAFASAQD